MCCCLCLMNVLLVAAAGGKSNSLEFSVMEATQQKRERDEDFGEFLVTSTIGSFVETDDVQISHMTLNKPKECTTETPRTSYSNSFHRNTCPSTSIEVLIQLGVIDTRWQQRQLWQHTPTLVDTLLLIYFQLFSFIYLSLSSLSLQRNGRAVGWLLLVECWLVCTPLVDRLVSVGIFSRC